MELITVIVPVFNTQEYLKKCVDSFLAQTYTDLEILLVNDGSTDESGKICDEYEKKDSRVRVIHKENGGLSDARNIGIKEAKGNLITFFDSDDYVDEDYIQYLYELKVKNNADISVCAYSIVNEVGDILFSVKDEKDGRLSKELFFKKMLNEEGITVSACFKLYEKSLFDSILFPIGKVCEDNGTTYKVIEKSSTDIAYGSKAKAYYVMRSNSLMRSAFSLKKMDMIELTDQMCDYLDTNYSNLHDYILRRRIYARFNVLRQMNYYDESTKPLMDELSGFILRYKWFILFNKIVPKRDKIACLILMCSKRMFFRSWEVYRKLKYDKTKG